ncbi:MAG TPA: hypothetical protein VM451_09270 [Candidatus Limnocylindria bacterium]|nr:hypothetical protein [Candidatus Limnocylindria bacterium]
MTRVRALAALAAAVVASTLLAACSTIVSAPGGSGGIPVATEKVSSDPIERQAKEALERWAAAVERSGGAAITFTGDMTSQIGDWEPGVGDNNKGALGAGLVEPMIDLPADPPARGEVKWVDGSSQGVDVLSAAAAMADLVAEGVAANSECSDCEPLRVTEAKLATTLVETSQGPANAPTWVFTIAGSDVRVTRIAVDDRVTVDPPPWNAEDPPAGVSIMSATGAADSKELEVSFVGAPQGKDEPCGADYKALAVESALAVVVVVTEDRHVNEPGVACRLIGAVRTATLKLDAKLGTRTVLEIRQGLPVPLQAPK